MLATESVAGPIVQTILDMHPVGGNLFRRKSSRRSLTDPVLSRAQLLVLDGEENASEWVFHRDRLQRVSVLLPLLLARSSNGNEEVVINIFW